MAVQGGGGHCGTYLHDRGRASTAAAELLRGVDAAHAQHHGPGSGGVALQNGLQAGLLRAIEFHVVPALPQRYGTSIRKQQQGRVGYRARELGGEGGGERGLQTKTRCARW